MLVVAALSMALAGCGGGEDDAAPVPTGIATPAPAPTVAPAATANSACVTGTWSVAAPDPHDAANRDMPVRHETAHFAFRWLDQVSNDADAREAGEFLEMAWGQFIDRIDMIQPFCSSAAKRKVNVFVGAGYGLSGGIDATGTPGMWIGPGGMRDRHGLAHEFTHALQGGTGGLQDSPYVGWLWEDHANWMTHQLPEFRSNTHCSVFQVNYPHLYYGTTRMRYCSWQFFEYVKNRFGYRAVSDIWNRAPRRGQPGFENADPLEVLMTNQGWTLSQLNDVFGDWAMHNANWDYTNPDGSDQGAVYRRNYGDYAPQEGDRFLRSTRLDPLDLGNRRFAVPTAWAPQRWGYNIVRLHPDGASGSVSVDFRGVVQQAPATTTLPGLVLDPPAVDQPSSDWRWGLVAVGADGKSRYSPLQRGADGRATLTVQQGDTGLYLIVMATPSTFHHIRWDQGYYSIYRYPWMVQFTGAMPEGYQANAPSPVPGGHRHANGGGWVAAGATVESGAYVGPYARVLSGSVLGRARVEDHAVVYGGTLRDDARASALSVIRGNTVLRDRAHAATTFLGLGEYEQGIVLSGTAQMVGDVEQRGASASKGVFYGFVAGDLDSDSTYGGLTAPLAEVTAAPNYVWRP
ncbi:hypothetical protein SAMN04488241_10943 [Sphingomonas rubra]|uniref:Avirulence protein n=2 Tax=Sphingomonas rubra TaxID=634430 RepID=A0A1I5TTW2_9SPHN|nr:hypothetical protein SAMN04488241_10943 [Sphingomonas rubra]